MITICLGLPGSGSTWLYNVVRTLIANSGTLAFEAENLPAIRDLLNHPTRNLLIKAHAIEHSFLYFSRAANARAIISSRDPKDGIASIMKRIQPNPYSAIPEVLRSFAATNSAHKMLPSCIFNYDSDFINKKETLYELLAFFGEEKSKSEIDNIFDLFTKENVHNFVRKIKEQEFTAFDPFSGMAYDQVTMFNEHHLGDGRSGKWQDIHDSFVRNELEVIFGAAAGDRIQTGQTLRFSESIFSGSPEIYYPPIVGPGLQVLSRCYLPYGAWHIRLVGQLVECAGAQFYLCHSGRIIASGTSDSRGDINLEFTYQNQAHDDHFSFHLGLDTTLALDPRREGRTTIIATYVG